MYYYRVEGNNVFRFKVGINKKRLNDIRQELIENSSIISHKSYNGVSSPLAIDFAHIRNYKSEFIGNESNQDLSSKTDSLTHYEYDEYTYPPLVHVIDKLLHDNPAGLKDLDEYKEQTSDEEEIDLIKEEQSIINALAKKETTLEDKIAELKRIEARLKGLQSSKKGRLPESVYYPEIISTLNMAYDSTITIKEFEKVANFMIGTDVKTIKEIIVRANQKEEQMKK